MFRPLQLYLTMMTISLALSFFFLISCDKNELLNAYKQKPFYNMKLTEHVPQHISQPGARDRNLILKGEPTNEVSIQHFRACFLIFFVISKYLFISKYLHIVLKWGLPGKGICLHFRTLAVEIWKTEKISCIFNVTDL